ncbi:FAD-dependent oxidoreductase [Rubellimicrobium rubrum]|uniref:FAD-dependent oxidoreductase n=1 Tax=Rubellimicrobium rubrum TaxID=2585369 RepID=A0A5C4MT74_9RHOB|nr:NAD(P)/FAD-dependent oxidoreductase [Rubellimicrobium rubrum]TNC47315.1 FAD-dependent oxidoreductase [Rubellimicrobium rubrum]
MSVETVETLIIGAGQAGLAMSAHLRRHGRPHLVLERHRIAERWRSERWDSLVANGPAWHDRFPAQEFDGLDPDAFAPKDRIVAYFECFAARIAAPIHCGVEVTEARPLPSGAGFRIETTAGPIEARNLVAATGPFQRPIVPDFVPRDVVPFQIHSAAYRNPDQLPEGGVLVVGAGSSGTQIADELNRAGRDVHLCVGPHDRPPRRYRGRDFTWWLGALGKWDARARTPGTEHVTIAVSGTRGGETIDFRRLGGEGINLLGRAEGYSEGRLRIARDLAANIARGDANYLSVLEEADAHAARHGLELPEDPEARRTYPDPACLTEPVLELDLKAAGIGSIIWATGYAFDFGWLRAGTFDAQGRPVHDRGASTVPGLWFVGLPWLTCRGSAFIWGAWKDAAEVADRIAARAPAPLTA